MNKHNISDISKFLLSLQTLKNLEINFKSITPTEHNFLEFIHDLIFALIAHPSYIIEP